MRFFVYPPADVGVFVKVPYFDDAAVHEYEFVFADRSEIHGGEFRCVEDANDTQSGLFVFRIDIYNLEGRYSVYMRQFLWS